MRVHLIVFFVQSAVLETDVAFVSPNKSSRSGGAAGDSSGATAGDADAAGDSADAGDTQTR